MIFERKMYLQRLINGRGNGMVKIITGVRRCGKSFLLFNLFRNWLLENGTPSDHILSLALDEQRNKKLLNPDTLLDYIDAHIIRDGQTTYLLLDEIQLVKDFIGVMISLMHEANVEVYVSGSNSRFLSSDVVTEFRGRGWEIRLHPLSFAEYYTQIGGDKMSALRSYYVYGGLPQVALMAYEEEKQQFLKNLYELTYLRDIINRNRILNDEGLRQIIQVLASSIGSGTNVQRIANTFNSKEHVAIKPMTIQKYLVHLEDAFIIQQALRYNIKGRKYIGTETKYYFEDLGVRNAILNFRQSDEFSHIMENVLYNELRHRGYSVDVGQVEIWAQNSQGTYARKNLEIDFVINKADKRIYIQSAYRLPDKEKIDQEQKSLLNVPDSFKKIIITDEYHPSHYNEMGVYIMGLFDFLLNPDSLNV